MSDQWQRYTVGELIDTLQQFPKDLPVSCEGVCDGGWGVDGGCEISIEIVKPGDNCRAQWDDIHEPTLQILGRF